MLFFQKPPYKKSAMTDNKGELMATHSWQKYFDLKTWLKRSTTGVGKCGLSNSVVEFNGT